MHGEKMQLHSLQCLALCILLSMVSRSLQEDYFIQHPNSQSVTLNSTLVLTCRLRADLFQETVPSSQKATVQWVRNKFGLGSTRTDIQDAGMEADSPASRYDLPYDLNKGQYDLQIKYAKSADEGQYVCQLRHNRNTHFSRTANIRVLVASEAPTLIQSDVYNAEDMRRVGIHVAASAAEGSYLRLHCIAKNGKPGAKLVWSLNGSPLIIVLNKDGTKGKIISPIEGNVSVRSISTPEPPFLVTAVSEVIIYVTRLHHGSIIKCTAQNEGYEDQPLQPAYTKLNILYAPVVKMRIIPATGQRNLIENDVVTVRCTAEGRPDNFTWSWRINGVLCEGENADQYRFSLSRKLINATVACIATSFAEGSDQAMLTFRYAPEFIDPNSTIYAGALGERIRMHCTVDGLPWPEVEWRITSTSSATSIDTSATVTPVGALVSRGEVFEREKILETDFGVYMCTALSLGFPPVSKKIILAKKSAPRIKPTEPIYAALGASTRLSCIIRAVPVPLSEEVLWFRQDVLLKPTSNCKFSTHEFLGGVVNVISIPLVTATDYGFYNCSATNAYGSDSQIIELRKDDELAVSSLSGVLASLAAAILLAFLVYFFCRRRQNRKTRFKGVLTKKAKKKNSEAKTDSCEYVHTNSLPQSMNLDSKNEAFCCHSSSGSTEAETLSRYQFLSSVIRSPFTVDNLHTRPPPSNSSQMVSVQPLPAICTKIPVCTNVVTFAGHSGTFRLADRNVTTLCIAPDCQPIPISYANIPISRETLPLATPDHVDVVAADSDVIVNTQVTSV